MEEYKEDLEKKSSVRSSVFIVNEPPPLIEDLDNSPGTFPPGATLLLFLDILICYTSTSFKSIKYLLLDQHGYSESSASNAYCSVIIMGIILPIVGAIISDNWIGKFKTLLLGSFLTTFGFIFITISSTQSLPVTVGFLFWTGVSFTVAGWGYIIPTFIPLAADQFKLPAQRSYLSCFFSIHFGIITVVTCACIIFTQLLNSSSPLDDNKSYSNIFLIPSLGMTAMTLLLSYKGWMFYYEFPVLAIVGDVHRCLYSAVRNLLRNGRTLGKHWVFSADGKYSEIFLNDVISALNIIIVLLPSIMIWCILRQFKSRCKTQAIRMNLMLFGHLIKPSEILIGVTLICCGLILVYHNIIFPILKVNNCHKPLSRMLIGGVLIGLALILSGMVELVIENHQGRNSLEPERGQLRIYSGVDCDYKLLNLPGQKEFLLKSMMFYEDVRTELHKSVVYNVTAEPLKNCGLLHQSTKHFPVIIQKNKAIGYFFTGTKYPLYFEDCIQKSENSYPYFRILANGVLDEIVVMKQENCTKMESKLKDMEVRNIHPGTYTVHFQRNAVSKDINLLPGGSYVLLVLKKGATFTLNLINYVKPNAVHVLWQIPQLLIFTTGEIMFIISGMEFVYLESPKSMSGFLWSYYNLIDGIGYLLYDMFALFHLEIPSEIFLCCGILTGILIIKHHLIHRYEYVNII